jgi:hypothetical protein
MLARQLTWSVTATAHVSVHASVATTLSRTRMFPACACRAHNCPARDWHSQHAVQATSEPALYASWASCSPLLPALPALMAGGVSPTCREWGAWPAFCTARDNPPCIPTSCSVPTLSLLPCHLCVQLKGSVSCACRIIPWLDASYSDANPITVTAAFACTLACSC